MSGAIGKFSDLPYYLSTEYFTDLRDSLYTTPDLSTDIVDLVDEQVNFIDGPLVFAAGGSLDWTHEYDRHESKIAKAYLDGARNTIFVRGGAWTDAYAKVDEYGYKPIRITPIAAPEAWVDENYLKFEVQDSLEKIPTEVVKRHTEEAAASFTVYDAQSVPRGNVPLEAGHEIYIRNDSLFHDWFKKTQTESANFINDRLQFAYFGEIYPIINSATWHIIYNGMKDFARAAFPENNMNDRLKEFLWTYFDKVYQEIYNMQKNVFTLLDPQEIDFRWLGYLEKQYGIEIDQFKTSQAQQRDFVKNTINFLKRKGAYSSIYIIWRSIARIPQESIKIYDRWHDSSITASPSGQWQDFEYIENYGGTYPSNYTVAPSGSILSTHYKIEINHSIKPLNTSVIMDQATMDSLMYGWDLIRPITRVAHYNQVVYPYTDFTGRIISLYEKPEAATWKSKCTAITETVAGAAIAIENLPTFACNVVHGLNTEDIIVQCFDTSLNRVFPANINIPNNRYVSVEFYEAFTGAIFVTAAEKSIEISTPAVYWNIPHMLNQKVVLSQLVTNDKDAFIPEELELLDNDNLTITTDNFKGYALIHKGEYVHEQLTPALTWTIDHNLGYIGAMIEAYDSSYKQILPDKIELLDANTATVTFASPMAGFIVAKRIGAPAVKKDIVNALLDPNSYYKLGDGTDIEWNARYNNDIQNQIYTDKLGTVTEDENNYYFNFEIPEGISLNITEIGLFNSSGIILFYTQGAELFKHENTVLNIKYKVSKVELL